jgi:conjugative transfer region protein TrbK
MVMAPFKWPHSLVIAGAGIALLAACAIQLRSNEDQDIAAAPQAAARSDAQDTRLTRCRAVLPEQMEAFEQCRHVWADNRRYFLGKDQSRATSSKEGAADQISGAQAAEYAR